jgi:hypothetical protein
LISSFPASGVSLAALGTARYAPAVGRSVRQVSILPGNNRFCNRNAAIKPL